MTAFIWAVAVIFFKKSGEKVHPIALNLFKDSLALLLFIPTAFAFRQPLRHAALPGELERLVGSGILGICVADTLFFYSLQFLGASLTAIVNCLYSPAVIFFSYTVLGERLNLMQWIGVTSIVSGVAIATWGRERGNLARRQVALGLVAGLGAIVSMAWGIVLMKPVLEHSPLIWASEVRLAAGLAGLIFVLAVHPFRATILRSLLIRGGRAYTLTGSFFGAYLALLPWLATFKLTLASTASALQQTSYLLVFIMAVIFLHERMTISKFLGIILGMAGAYLVSFG